MTVVARVHVVDADAFLCLRALKLLPVLEASPAKLAITEYVAWHELSTVSGALESLVRVGVLEVPRVGSRNDDFRRLRRDNVDKGEAELIAWCLGNQPCGPIIITNDRGARARCLAESVEAGDVLDLAAQLVRLGSLTLGELRPLLAPWDDRTQQCCRPPDYGNDGLDGVLRKRGYQLDR